MIILIWCWKQDSNLRSRKAGDLQSPVIATTRFQQVCYLSGGLNQENFQLSHEFTRGAASRIRTVDVLFTKQLL